jgi:S-formylglutathione hydrolase FrmB
MYFMLVFLPLAGQVSIEKNRTFYSHILKREMLFSLLLPANYYSNDQVYPVIYLLHGFGGDNNSWLERCKIDVLIDSLADHNLTGECIYILPDADNSYYINNADSSFKYEDYFINELIPHIDSTFRTKRCNKGRALMGLSMGGFGAVILAIKHPDMFTAVASLSGAIRDSTIFVNLPDNRYETFFSTVFGPSLKGGGRITDHWKSNSPYYLVDSITAQSMKQINWYIDCGMDDDLFPANERFHDLLVKNKIPHEFHMRPGSHNWSYWYNSSIYGLVFIFKSEGDCS